MLIISKRRHEINAKDGYDSMAEEDIAQVMGISQGRVSQVITNLLGANIFVKDKAKVKDATGLKSRGGKRQGAMDNTHLTIAMAQGFSAFANGCQSFNW